MGITKLTKLGENAASSAIEDTSTFEDWVGSGWVDERVPYPRLNRHGYRGDDKINELISAVGGGEAREYFIKGFFPESESSMSIYDSNNRIAPTAFPYCYDLTFTQLSGVNYVIGCGNKTLLMYNIDEMTEGNEISETVLKEGLESVTHTGSYYPRAICNDGTYAYVLFKYTDSAPDEYFVQSYTLSDWDPNTNWPTNGLQLTAHAQTVADDEIVLGVANDTYLYATQPWVTVSSGTSSGINIINKTTGVSAGTGSGDCGSVTSAQVTRACSDGTYIYFTVEESADTTIASMSISSPGATGCGWINGPYASGISAGNTGGIAVGGATVVVTWHDGTNLFSKLNTTQGLSAIVQTTDVDIAQNLGAVCTDGINFWAIGDRDPEGHSSPDIKMLFRLDGVHNAGYFSTTNYETYSSGQGLLRGFKIQADTDTAWTPETIPILCDGINVWTGLSNSSGEIARLAKAVTRA